VPTFHPLSLDERARLFAQLAALEDAGMPAQQACRSIRLGGQTQPRLQAMAAQLVRGRNLADAGRASGLFTALEATMLAAACQGGSPAGCYRRLAGLYAEQDRLAKAVRSRMALPALVLVLALFIRPVPALVSGAIGLGAYLRAALLPLLGLGMAGLLWQRLPRWAEAGRIASLLLLYSQVVRLLPLFGQRHARRQAQRFFESLGLLLEAGLPMFEAISPAAATVNDARLQQAYQALLPGLRRGDSLFQAVQGLPPAVLGGQTQVLGLIHTGEESGSLPQLLQRFAQQEAQDDAHFRQQVADWLPRLAYAAVAAWMAWGLLHSGLGMPAAP
jgi:general secretion pathway protein F